MPAPQKHRAAYGVGVGVGGVGNGVEVGVGRERGTGGFVGSGVAIGSTGNAEVGTSELCGSGRGVTIAIEPLGCAAIVASVRAGTSEPGCSTKFLPWRKICHSE